MRSRFQKWGDSEARFPQAPVCMKVLSEEAVQGVQEKMRPSKARAGGIWDKELPQV